MPTCSARPSVAGLDSLTYADRLVRAWGSATAPQLAAKPPGAAIREAVASGFAISVAAVPEGLPLSATLCPAGRCPASGDRGGAREDTGGR